MDPARLLDLRILVAALGEAHHTGWWQSQFLSTIGMSYLAYPFPRSAFAAAARSACQSARLAHDEAIGRGQVMHLFRLDEQDERTLDSYLAEHATSLEERLHNDRDNRERLLHQLANLARGSVVNPAIGPVLADMSGDWTPTWAALYYDGFVSGQGVYPYATIENAATEHG